MTEPEQVPRWAGWALILGFLLLAWALILLGLLALAGAL